jgi:signal transduction histidine kinase/CheY-like chemotaxis protein
VALRANGEEFSIDLALAEATEGSRRTFIGTVRDITVRKALEEQLLQAQRLESVGRLAGGIAHDFNNVLTAIVGFAQIMLQELPPKDPQRANAETIQDAANRATTLVRQLLAFGRQQVLRPEVLDLGDVVRGITPMLDRLLGEDVQISVSPTDGRWPVEADRSQLEQVIVNLAVNARDAMPKGGRLTIETSEVELDPDYARIHPEVAPGRHVMLAVSDSGSGMDLETQAHIFEPFFTTKEPGQGTGLGLATVYGIVRQSGGHIWVYSEPDHGTTFRLYFPRAAAPGEVDMETAAAEAAERQAALPRKSSAGTETILVAEDEESLRVLLDLVLRRLGYTVLVAEDAERALEIAQSRPIDLLVTDIVMPGQSGLELAAAVRKLMPDARILFMSGYTAAALKGHGQFATGEGLLEKPFTPEALGAAVRRELDSRPSPSPTE